MGESLESQGFRESALVASTLRDRLLFSLPTVGKRTLRSAQAHAIAKKM